MSFMHIFKTAQLIVENSAQTSFRFSPFNFCAPWIVSAETRAPWQKQPQEQLGCIISLRLDYLSLYPRGWQVVVVSYTNLDIFWGPVGQGDHGSQAALAWIQLWQVSSNVFSSSLKLRHNKLGCSVSFQQFRKRQDPTRVEHLIG